MDIADTLPSDETGPDSEFVAMQSVYGSLVNLDDAARRRVVEYIIARLDISTQAIGRNPGAGSAGADSADDTALETGKVSATNYGSLAELYEATQPTSNAHKALVAGYWLQECRGADSFEGFLVNKELKNLGHGIANITTAIDGLKAQAPALVLQLKKSGTSRQARKTYKVTVAGIKWVVDRING